MPKQVLIWPSPWDYRLKNGLFSQGFSLRGAFQRAFQLWQTAATAAGFELNTWDMRPLESADLLCFINLPKTRSELESARLKAPRAKTLLMVNESPLLAPATHEIANQALFDFVVTFTRKNCDNWRVFPYRLPLTRQFPARNPKYSQRKILGMVNTNRVEGFWAVRQRGATGLPGIGPLLGGWHLSPFELWKIYQNDLYAVRRDLVREAGRFDSPVMEVFGKGWNGEQISWCPLYRNRPYQAWRKAFVEDKVDVLSDYRFCLAFENFRGSLDYVDVKVFDGLLAGSVPVYLGEEQITDFLPATAFVDARNFRTHRELLAYLNSCPEPEWAAMREAGQQFLKSEAFTPFSDEAFAEQMTEILKKIIS